LKTTTLTILNSLGLHARPSAKIAKLANQYDSEIQLTANEKTIDAKSIMQLMMLAAKQGTNVTLTATGNEEEQAIAALSELFNSAFDEKT
jgi:phosphocarrier protein